MRFLGKARQIPNALLAALLVLTAPAVANETRLAVRAPAIHVISGNDSLHASATKIHVFSVQSDLAVRAPSIRVIAAASDFHVQAPKIHVLTAQSDLAVSAPVISVFAWEDAPPQRGPAIAVAEPANNPDQVFSLQRCPPLDDYAIRLKAHEDAGGNVDAEEARLQVAILGAAKYMTRFRMDLWCEHVTERLPAIE